MGFHVRLTGPPTDPLHPINPSNARHLRITAAAGTELAVAFSAGTVTCKAYSAPQDSSPLKGVYNPKTFILHAASHRQAFAHCERFSTAASRRSLGSVSVPVWLTILSDQLPVVALVGLYPTNKLIGRGLIPNRQPCGHLFPQPHAGSWSHLVLACLSTCYPRFGGKLPTYYSPFCRYPLRDRSTCMPKPRRQRSL